MLPECANWLRFGIQPKCPGPGLKPGFCPSKAHDREHLADDGLPRYLWTPVLVEPDEYAFLILASEIETQRWRREYDSARGAHPRRAGPAAPEAKVSV